MNARFALWVPPEKLLLEIDDERAHFVQFRMQSPPMIRRAVIGAANSRSHFAKAGAQVPSQQRPCCLAPPQGEPPRRWAHVAERGQIRRVADRSGEPVASRESCRSVLRQQVRPCSAPRCERGGARHWVGRARLRPGRIPFAAFKCCQLAQPRQSARSLEEVSPFSARTSGSRPPRDTLI
jgi:hypothetical protein